MQFAAKLGLALQLAPTKFLHILNSPGTSSSNCQSEMPISFVNSLRSSAVISQSGLRAAGVSVAGMGVFVGTDVDVFVGTGVFVGKGVDVGGTNVFVGIGVFVGKMVDVGGIGVEAGTHPLTKTVRKTKTRKADRIDFFMALCSFDLIVQRSRLTRKLMECALHF